MKHLTYITSILFAVAAHAQLPMPCLNYDENNFGQLIQFNGWRSTTCLNIDSHQNNSGDVVTGIIDNHIREFVVNEAQISPGFLYIPDEHEDAMLSITLGNREEMEAVWFEPNHYSPQLYEKIEWGFKLPAEVEVAIDNWIHNDQYPLDPPLSPALNPFDPDQIDLHAVIDYTTTNNVYFSQPVNGFFYEEFDRITDESNPSSDPDDWHWDKVPSEFRFRIRWSSAEVAHHSVRVLLDVPSFGNWEMQAFEFNSFWGDPRNSFIDITDNGHYFKTVDGHIFFPIGLNINEATFGCGCKHIGEPVENCSECYEWGENDPCCGISLDKRKRHSMPGTSLKARTIAAAGYLKLEHILETLQATGGNSFRTLFDPISFEIEFEKLNNYYDRQYQAWEFDMVLNKCHDLGLRIEWNHMIHYSVSHHWFGGDNWDWDNTENTTGGGIRPNDSGYAYWHGCDGATSPVDFLTNPCAIENYKKKLRYMIARWGYSRNIFVMELMSEMNNIGNGQLDAEDMPTPYDVDAAAVRPLVAWWHNEMARYIKVDLHHTRHLIAANYTGKGPMSDYPDAAPGNPCASDYFDSSWQSPHIDVAAYNSYGGSIKKFKGLGDSFGVVEPDEGDSDDEMDVFPGFLCNESVGSEIIGFEHMSKPVINPETGFFAIDCDATGFIKELMTIPFCGYASCGMSWDEWNSTSQWHWFNRLKLFLDNELFDAIDIGTEEWVPDWTESANGLGETGHVEAVYLRSDEPNHKKLIGIILNRTWNWYTASSGGPCDQIPMTINAEGNVVEDLGVLPTYARTLLEIGDGQEPIRIGFMELAKRYHIKYYNPVNLNVVNEETTNTVDQRLRLEGYPSLTAAMPFVFFKAWRDPIGDNDDEFSPMLEEAYVESDRVNVNSPNSENLIQDLPLTTATFGRISAEELTLRPTGANAAIFVSMNTMSTFDLEIYDNIGNLVMKENKYASNSELDISKLAPGCYHLQVTGLPYSKPFVKL